MGVVVDMNVSYLSYVAEYVGAFFFILTILVSGGNPLIVGASLALVIFLLANVSGAHVNPAVSLSMFLHGSIRPMELFSYVFAQLLGGVSAYYAYNMAK
jgi:glycerol uptake facilitator-like aquaporin